MGEAVSRGRNCFNYHAHLGGHPGSSPVPPELEPEGGGNRRFQGFVGLIRSICCSNPETGCMMLLQTCRGGRQPISQGRSTTPDGSALTRVVVHVDGPCGDSCLPGPRGLE